MATSRDWSAREDMLMRMAVAVVTVWAVLNCVTSVPVGGPPHSPCVYGSKRDTSLPADDVSRPTSKRQQPMCFTSFLDCLMYMMPYKADLRNCKPKFTPQNATYWESGKRHVSDSFADDENVGGDRDVSKRSPEDADHDADVDDDDLVEEVLDALVDTHEGDQTKREIN